MIRSSGSTIGADEKWDSAGSDRVSFVGSSFTLRSRKVFCLFLIISACVACGHSPADVNPSIIFTRIPRVNPGGPLSMGNIAGRVNGPHEGLKVVLYAKSGRWYVQPYADQPFTTIQPDSSWGSPTHLGTDYGAVLVRPGYVAPPVLDNLPSVGGGVIAVAVTEGTPAVWQRWWFRLLAGLLVAAAIVAFYRWRIRRMARQLSVRFEERLAERTRIAQELHDTLLQGLLSISMQIHVAADQLPDESPARATLDQVKGLMAQVIKEGRNTIRGLRSSIQSPNDLVTSFSQIPLELGDKGVNFRLIVEGASVALRPAIRDEVYRIGREALVNALRHSRARNINLHLEYAPDQLRIVLDDDGCGIDSQVLQSGRDGHWGLSGMRERADNIGGKLRIMSRVGGGTDVELRLDSHLAFESAPASLTSKLAAKLQQRE